MTEMINYHNYELDQAEQSALTQLAIIKEMRNIKQSVKETEQRLISMVDKVSKEITINYEEQKVIQSIVWKLSTDLAREHLDGRKYSDNLFKAWKGLFTRRIHSKLKNRMNVVRYTAIKREDYETAIRFIESIRYVSFSIADLNPTPAILRIIDEEESR